MLKASLEALEEPSVLEEGLQGVELKARVLKSIFGRSKVVDVDRVNRQWATCAKELLPAHVHTDRVNNHVFYMIKRSARAINARR